MFEVDDMGSRAERQENTWAAEQIHEGLAAWRIASATGYDAADYDFLWQAVEAHVPGLLTTVEQMLQDLAH